MQFKIQMYHFWAQLYNQSGSGWKWLNVAAYNHWVLLDIFFNHTCHTPPLDEMSDPEKSTKLHIFRNFICNLNKYLLKFQPFPLGINRELRPQIHEKHESLI